MAASGDKHFPYEIKDVTRDETETIQQFFNGEVLDYVRVGPKDYFMPKGYENLAADIYNLPLRTDDVFVISFPKSGTTWTQDLVWLLMNNFDFEKAKSISLNDRFPFIEISSFFISSNRPVIPDDKLEEAMKALVPLTVPQIYEMPSPRFIKSHLPLSLLPPKLLETTKVIHVARDVRDVIVSFYYHNLFMKVMAQGTDFKEYTKYFIANRCFWTPYFENVLESWEKRHHPNMLFLFYEELSKDLPGSIRRIADFLGKEVTEENVKQLCEHLKFDNFKKNKSVNMSQMQEAGVFSSDGAFIRKGKAGEWREHFDEELVDLTEKWIKDHLKNTDFRFYNV